MTDPVPSVEQGQGGLADSPSPTADSNQVANRREAQEQFWALTEVSQLSPNTKKVLHDLLDDQPDTEQCPVCFGDGYIRIQHPNEELSREQCGYCGGSGRVEHDDNPLGQSWSIASLPKETKVALYAVLEAEVIGQNEYGNIGYDGEDMVDETTDAMFARNDLRAEQRTNLKRLCGIGGSNG